MTSTEMSSLLSLPDEILSIVIVYLGCHKDIISISTTCHRLYRLAKNFVYAFLNLDFEQALILFHSLSPQTGLTLLASEHDEVESNKWAAVPEDESLGFPNRDWRFSVLTLTLSDNRDLAAGYFASWIQQLQNLEELKIVSPFWHFSDFGNEPQSQAIRRYDGNGKPLRDAENSKTDWPFEQDKLNQMFQQNSILQPDLTQRLLPSLRSCHIEYREMNGQHWFLDFEPVFFSSTITHLTLQGCFFHEGDFFDYVDENRNIRESLRSSTPLQRLILLDCHIDPMAMTRMMTIPKRLRVLGVDQSRYTHHELAPTTHFAEKVGDIFQTLTSQNKSLRELYFGNVPEVSGRDADVPVDLREFQSLQAICLGDWLDLLQLSDADGRESKGLILPKSLRILRLQEIGIDVITAPSSTNILDEVSHELSIAHRFKESGCPDLEVIILPLALQRSQRALNSQADAQWMVDEDYYHPLWQKDQSNHEFRLLEPRPRFRKYLDDSAWNVLRECTKEMKDKGINLQFEVRFA